MIVIEHQYRKEHKNSFKSVLRGLGRVLDYRLLEVCKIFNFYKTVYEL